VNIVIIQVSQEHGIFGLNEQLLTFKDEFFSMEFIIF
jgi:hypothetical protein